MATKKYDEDFKQMIVELYEILGINLEDEIQKKIYKNSKREYKVIDGVNTRVKEFEEDTER